MSIVPAPSSSRTSSADHSPTGSVRSVAVVSSAAWSISASAAAARARAAASAAAPAALAATSAAKSPAVSVGTRTPASSFSLASSSGIGGSRTPSSSMCRESPMPPGNVPPTSARCARLATNPPSPPAAAVTSVTSGKWLPPRYGSFTSTCSPGKSPGKSAKTAATLAGIDPRCTGTCAACASSRPRESNSAHEKSRRSLMFALNAARCSTCPIRSAAPSSRWATICNGARSTIKRSPAPPARRLKVAAAQRAAVGHHATRIPDCGPFDRSYLKV